MPIKATLFLLGALFAFSGCGRSVPDLTPSGKDQLFVEDVHLAIQCELTKAIHEAYRQSSAAAALGAKGTDFFKTWGIKYTVTLNVAESLSAGASLGGTSDVTPTAGDTVATVGVGFGGSAKATRVETDQSFQTVAHYARRKSCADNTDNKIAPNGRDLGIGGWMRTRVSLVHRDIITSVNEAESFTYKVQFDIVRSGSFAPTWTFVQRHLGSADLSLAGSRSTAHSVLVTFGPTERGDTELAPPASAVHNANLIGTFVDF